MNPEDFEFAQLLEEKEWRKCAPRSNDPDVLLAGFLYFCENYWFIRHPERGRIKFDLFEAQVETIESWLSTRYSLILKAMFLLSGYVVVLLSTNYIAEGDYWENEYYGLMVSSLLGMVVNSARQVDQKVKPRSWTSRSSLRCSTSRE